MYKIESKEFFEFGGKLVLTTVQAHSIDLKISTNNLTKGDYTGVEFPVTFKQEYGKKYTDILGTGTCALYLISDRMKTILEENQLTGWQTFPIKLYDKKKTEIPGYQGFSILGSCGQTNYDNSEIIEKQYAPNAPICRIYKGVSIDKWDGTDFFIPEKTLHIFITKKAADILTNNKITNMVLENLAEMEMDVRHVKMESSS